MNCMHCNGVRIVIDARGNPKACFECSYLADVFDLAIELLDRIEERHRWKTARDIAAHNQRIARLEERTA